ncbi:MAG: enoyl-CoA hydratase/isomerase family protein [Acetobacter sp.]|nr:enoyl-CoA hydratase/isomerase family protein [Acetobacter sp.]MBR2124168.1 enoyl-CoA hydratase/isomerase family protein [Acetobacter sp.]
MIEKTLSGLDDVKTEQRGHVGRIILDRPKRLNALDAEMSQAIMRVLEAWRHDTAITLILLESSSPRAFCAGGDLRAIREALFAYGPDKTYTLMNQAYNVMLQLADYPKSVVSFLDGIVMGGGVGLGCLVGHRIVTERSILAMPETSIGLVTDAGQSWLLSRGKTPIGLRFALTGARITGEQAVLLGLADAYVLSENLEGLRQALFHESIDVVLSQFATTVQKANIIPEVLEACYAAPTMVEILTRLEACPLQEAKEDLETLKQSSPTSLEASWYGWHAARKLTTVHEVFDLERRLVRYVLGQPDLAEGVRARLVDRDNTPVWKPNQLELVDTKAIDSVVKRCD